MCSRAARSRVALLRGINCNHKFEVRSLFTSACLGSSRNRNKRGPSTPWRPSSPDIGDSMVVRARVDSSLQKMSGSTNEMKRVQPNPRGERSPLSSFEDTLAEDAVMRFKSQMRSQRALVEKSMRGEIPVGSEQNPLSLDLDTFHPSMFPNDVEYEIVLKSVEDGALPISTYPEPPPLRREAIHELAEDIGAVDEENDESTSLDENGIDDEETTKELASLLHIPSDTDQAFKRKLPTKAYLRTRTIPTIPVEQLEYNFSRSPGKGGQNVNRRETQVEIKLHIDDLTWLPQPVRVVFIRRTRPLHNKNGEIIFKSNRHRTQSQNRSDVLEKICQFIKDAQDEVAVHVFFLNLSQNKGVMTKAEVAAYKSRRNEDRRRRRRFNNADTATLAADAEQSNLSEPLPVTDPDVVIRELKLNSMQEYFQFLVKPTPEMIMRMPPKYRHYYQSEAKFKAALEKAEADALSKLSPQQLAAMEECRKQNDERFQLDLEELRREEGGFNPPQVSEEILRLRGDRS